MTDTSVDDAKDLESEAGIVSRWDDEIKAYDKASKDWVKDGKRIIKRYSLKDRKSDTTDSDTRFNILWSNVQTRKPAIFARIPIPVIERRFRDKDPVGRVASQMLERAVSTDMEADEIDVTAEQIVEDVELVGRGIPWVRYDPDIVTTQTSVSPTEEGQFVDESGNIHAEADEEDGLFTVSSEVVASERAPVDYVYWEDFYHKPVKNWAELEKDGWIAKRVFMTKRQGIERFGERFKDVPLTATPKGMEEQVTDKVSPVEKLAVIFEIWNAADKEVIWIAREFKDAPLDRQPDPLNLERFFPCPRAAYATLTNNSLIPVPDYLQYEPQAQELDDITERITILQDAIRVAGIYDANLEGLSTLLSSDTASNVMIPVSNLAAVMAKGSTGGTITNVVQFLPLDMIITALLALYDARDRVKQTIFEISGVSDILRGNVDPREKLGQSKIKGQFATLRLDRRQNEIARMLRDVIRIKSEIIAEQFEDSTLREISGFDQIAEVIQAKKKAGEQAIAQVMQQAEQKAQQIQQQVQQNPQFAQLAQQQIAQIQQQAQAMAQQAGQQASEQADQQMFQSAAQLIRDDKTRGFRIDIETDSTIAVDEQEAKEARVEFLTAAGEFLQQALPVAQKIPQIAPLMGDMLLFAVRGFKAGRPLEASFEEAVEEMRNAEPQQQPDPEAIKAQADQEAAKAKLELDRETAQGELQLKREVAQGELQIKRAVAAGDTGELKQQLDIEKARGEIALKREIAAAEIGLKQQGLEADMALESTVNKASETVTQSAEALSQAAQALAQAVATISSSAQAIAAAAEDISAPKEIVRDETGRATGVRRKA